MWLIVKLTAPTSLTDRLTVYINSTQYSLPTGLPSDIDTFLSCGANKVLLKPLDLEAFSQAMKDTMKVL